MIKITSIEITDFGRHHSIKSKLQGCVVGLAGPNGRGKSTVLQAIQFGLTGTIDHPDPLRAFIRRSSGENPPAAAEVTLEFVADGKVGKIQRRITRTTVTRKLWWDGAEKPITSDAEVSSIMLDILGVDKKAINSTVFIRQGEMASMFGLETDRREFYTKLLMLGHLAKIANVIETHRETVASSVQDLGAVRDAAQASYEEARRFFETCESEMKGLPSPAEYLALVRNVSSQYSAVAAAEDAATAAKTQLQQHVPAGEDAALWLVNARQQQQEWQKKLTSLTQRKQANLQASADQSKTDLALLSARGLKQQFAELADAEAKLKEAGELGDSPESSVKRAEAMLKKFDDLDTLTTSIPGATASEREAEEKVTAGTEVVAALQTAYDANRESYVLIRNALQMRRDLLRGLEVGGGHSDHCPLCGGTTPPDPEHLRKEITDLEGQLKKAEDKGVVSGDALRAKQKDAGALQRAHATLADALAKHLNDQRRLQIETSLTTRETTQQGLNEATAKLQAWHAKAHEHARLTQVVDRYRVAVKGKTEPTQHEIDNLVAQEASQAQALKDAPWRALIDGAMLHDAAEEAKSTSDAVETVQKQIAEVDAAQRSMEAAHDSLRKLLADVPLGFFPSDGAPVLTQQMVQSKLTELEKAQQTLDEARGRHDAANESMKAASRKIDELDLRTAEQKTRLALAKDLEMLRDTFRPNGASLEFLNYKFGQIAQLAGDYLAESGADFMVSASEDLPLSYDFLRTDRADEAWMPQSRMSGGQKVRLAVATLRALHAMIMPNVGLLSLDEPTTHLDEEAKRAMADMLRKIGEEGTLQMIVCDHSPTLIEAFSDRIELPA
jgi:exonuclease SbcC